MQKTKKIITKTRNFKSTKVSFVLEYILGEGCLKGEMNGRKICE